MNFDFVALKQMLAPLQSCQSVVVGFSGGMDSMVLLYSLRQLQKKGEVSFSIRALHVNHNLQADADNWQKFCEKVCAKLGVELYCEKVLISETGENTSASENKARAVRYKVFKEQIEVNETLLLAHHLDDQLETMLFRLNRGSSVKGLSAVPQSRVFGKGFIFRPLLKFDRLALTRFAEEHELWWVEDLSNQALEFDRNYIRNKILPAIESRWPSYRSSWSKSLQLIVEASEMLDELADLDLEKLESNESTSISIKHLQLLSSSRQRNLIRRWLEKIDLPEIGWNRLHNFVEKFIVADKKSESTFSIEGSNFACYQNFLYLLPTLDAPGKGIVWQANRNRQVKLVNNGKLLLKELPSGGIAPTCLEKVEVRFRQGGESCHLSRRPKKSLKKVLQESRIEPWLRDRVPLLYQDEELVCIPGVGIGEGSEVKPGEPGFEVIWHRPKAKNLR